jgi:anti-sigma B factor antagonist
VDKIETLVWHDTNITLKNVESFRIAMEGFIQKDAQNLILDLQNIEYLNSSALGIIADEVIKARRSNKELIIIGVQDSVLEIFKIVKFETFIKIFKDVQEVEDYLNRP